MEVIPGSHLDAPAIHLPEVDVDQCTIRPHQLRLQDRISIRLVPGDALIFHALIHHYAAPSRSSRQPHAVQFHYHQHGMPWTSLDAHRRRLHDESDAYADCTVQKEPVPPGKQFTYLGGRGRPIRPLEDWG